MFVYWIKKVFINNNIVSRNVMEIIKLLIKIELYVNVLFVNGVKFILK